jgi:hypothetical protein
MTFAGVGFSAEGLFEEIGSRPRSTIPRGAIECIRLRYGVRARHPFMLALFGVMLIAVGATPIPHLMSWLRHGGTAFDLEVLVLVLVVFGASAIYEAVQRGYRLDVETAFGRQRLEFHKGAPLAEIETFIGQVERYFGYSVEREDVPGLARGPRDL